MSLFQSRDKVKSKDTVKKSYPSARLHAQENYDYNAQFVASDRRMFNHYRLSYERSILREETRDPRDDGTCKSLPFLLAQWDIEGPSHTAGLTFLMSGNHEKAPTRSPS
jgi:hypothetical protein